MESGPKQPIESNEGVSQKEQIQTVLSALNGAKSMPAGSERDAFVQEQFDALAGVIPPSINRAMDVGGRKIWQFIAQGEGFDLSVNVVATQESIVVNCVMD